MRAARPPRRSARLPALAAAVLCLVLPSAAFAQSGTTLHGHVYGPGGTPLAGARVQVTAERGEGAETRSDSAGAYRVQLPGNGRSYVVSAEADGINPVTRLLGAAPAARELTLDLRLLSRAVPLRPITVRIPRLTVAGATEWVPGSSEGSHSGYEMQGAPLGSDELTDLLGREIGVARTSAGGAAGVSVAGQAPDQTRLTLDGSEAPQGAVPREAVREVSVLTNPYDVGRGRFSGGQVDVRTQAAGNPWGASLRLDRRDPRLRFGDAPAALRTHASEWRLDGGGGGAAQPRSARDHAGSRRFAGVARGAGARRRADGRGRAADGRARNLLSRRRARPALPAAGAAGRRGDRVGDRPGSAAAADSRMIGPQEWKQT